jgi:hypothetical protein
LVHVNYFYRDSSYLIKRNARKQYGLPHRKLTNEAARRFVLPYGRYMGYYAGAVAIHDPQYLAWLYDNLKNVNSEAAFSYPRLGMVHITSVIKALDLVDDRRPRSERKKYAQSE